MEDFAEKVAGYVNVEPAETINHVNDCLSRKIDVKEAKTIMARWAGWTGIENNNYK